MHIEYEQICGYCGCKCRIEIPMPPFNNKNVEEYQCPECTRVSKVKASEAPSITMLEARTDGRSDHCPDQFNAEVSATR